MALDPDTVLFLTAGATAALGALVAAIAYRGARRNDSDAMRFLAVGVVCIAVLPFLVSYPLASLLSLSDAQTILGVLSANVLGLLAVLYSLDGT